MISKNNPKVTDPGVEKSTVLIGFPSYLMINEIALKTAIYNLLHESQFNVQAPMRKAGAMLAV